MNTQDTVIDWTEANQRLLVAEFARLRALLGEGDATVTTEVADALRANMPAPAAIDRLSSTFELSNFERDTLLLCAGVEMDSGLAALCANGARGAQATFGIALATLPDAHWSALTPVRPLRHWRMVEIDEREGIANARLRIDERVLHYLAGVNYLDTRLQSLLRPLSPPRAMAGPHRQAVDTILYALRDNPHGRALVLLHGDDADGQADIAAQAAAEIGLRTHALCGEDLPQAPAELDAFSVLWQRETALLDVTLLIESATAECDTGIARLTDRLGVLCFVAGREPLTLDCPIASVRVDRPDAQEQKRLWELALGQATGRLNGSLNGVATQFRFSAGAILAKGEALRMTVETRDDPDAAFWNACRGLGRRRLDDLAQRITPAAGRDDLILPGAQQSLLREITAHVRQRLTVYDDWGFARKGARGLGITALFTGESGTGKTMAAEVLAGELHLDLYRIDLASVVSKYIGETEKSLKQVFDAAEDSGAILLFDEADALFGKRSEVRDSHDRYANIEVSYLLQRMEAYSGLAILTTNHKAALDTAFQRRLRFVVHFPFPDQLQREAIWRTIFPVDTPRNGIDYTKLARLNVTGGTIRNIALSAAFHAAESGTPVGMTHLLHGAHMEAAKRDKPYSEAETRGWV